MNYSFKKTLSNIVRTVILIPFLLIVNFLYSQNIDFNKNESSINLFRLSNSPNNTEDVFKNPFHFIPLSSLTYSRYINNKNAIEFTYYRPVIKKYKTEIDNQLNEQEYKEHFFLKLVLQKPKIEKL